MATKTIKANVTIGVAGAAGTRHVPDGRGNFVEVPCIETEYVPPGTPVTLDATEADVILARFGGEVVEAHDEEELSPPIKQRPRR